MNRTAATVTALALLGATPASAGDWIDTRLSFAFTDDNILAREGETTPSSPNARFGAGQQNNQFYDNVNTRFSGFETLSNLTLYKNIPGFFEGLTTEAALTVNLLERSDGSIALRDNSSYIRLVYRPQGWGEKDNISFTGFPVSADRFRLGYAFRITWGGNGAFTPLGLANGVPGAKLQVNRQIDSDRGWYAFVGAKTALIFNNLSRELATNYAGLAGAGIDLHKNVRLDVSGGYFQKGVVPELAIQGIEAPVNAAGASAQLVVHQGIPVGTSIDLTLYKNDPELYQRLFKPETYDPDGPVAWQVSLEASHLAQTLVNPDVFGQTRAQTAQAAALQGRLKKDYWRANLVGLYRTLSFIQNEVPGFPPYRDFPNGTTLQPEVFIAGGVDYHFPKLHFTPGVILGVQQPASFTASNSFLGGNNPPDVFTGKRTVVLRDVNLVSILPEGQAAMPVFSAKTTFRWDLSETVAGIGELYYTRDENRVTFRDDQTGTPQPSFEKPDAVGFNLVLQARF